MNKEPYAADLEHWLTVARENGHTITRSNTRLTANWNCAGSEPCDACIVVHRDRVLHASVDHPHPYHT